MLPEPANPIRKKPSALNFKNHTEEEFNLQKFAKETNLQVPSSSSLLTLSPENFRDVRCVGKGSQGEVYLTTYLPSNITLAKKVVSVTDEGALKTIMGELRMSETIDHPNIVKCYGCFMSKNTISMMLEFMDMGSLQNLLEKPIPEPILSYIARQILDGLSFLHHVKKVIHRDIKPANVLMNTKGEIKISDFGISRTVDSTMGQVTTFVGSKKYMSPERINGEHYGILSDIWSLGIMLYELALGAFPVKMGQNMAAIELVQLLGSQNYSEFPDSFSPELKVFLRKMLQKDPAFRIRSDILKKESFITNHLGVGAQDFLNFNLQLRGKRA